MNLGLIILTLSLIQYNIITVDNKICKIKQNNYLNYLNEVVDHMCTQNGWKSMENLYLNIDPMGNINVPDLIGRQLDRSNLIITFYNIVHILNYNYNEVLLIFVKLLNVIVDKCKHFLDAELLDNFFNCTKALQKSVKDSLTMFENLYNAITFIRYIDLNLKNLKVDELQSYLYTTDDDIYQIKNHNFFKNVQDEKYYDYHQIFLDVRNFIDNVFKIANNFFEKYKFIQNIYENDDCKMICEIEYSSQTIDSQEFISFMYQKVNSFYTETIKNNYEDLGFIQLINPTIDKFKPPIDQTINQEVGIMSLNIILSEGSWSSFNHIEIQYDDLKISAERVFRDPVTDHNFHLKKNYIALMVRCRFLEVLLYYNSTLSALKIMCDNEKFKTIPKHYVDCVTYLFDVINDTVKMFDFMLTILEKMKLSAIWPTTSSYSNLISTHKLIRNYVINLKTRNVVRDMFVNKPGIPIEKIADDYVKCFIYARYDTSNMLRAFKSQIKNRCYSDCLIVTTKDLIIKLKNTASFINETMSNDSRVSDYEFISIYLYEFCEHFIKTFCLDTGFHKIHENFIWTWK
ncbi:uncharacterized protein LOC126899138 isoform X1 [Daktulosphaira vitifoliae]|uniref:uncharacterized protein LOC126899138 isoform X1 n=1 Tax=Daktulosphaira vitifoliae TaxID=58002 RepID=UPI0021AA42F0|nr:uncharacterized protein LOC126899138 isoform X1 [Daktulosphaira vitifoliae]